MTHPAYNHAARVRQRSMAEQRSTYRGRKAMGQIELYDKTPTYLVSQKYPKMGFVYSDSSDDRQMLLRLGVGEIGATLVIPYLRQTPRISDPDAQGVIKVVEAVQRGLNQLGCGLRVDGFLGAKSTHCLKQVAGVSWHDKTWLQLLGDTIGAIDAGMRVRSTNGVQAVGAYYDLGAEAALQYQTVNGVCVARNDYTRQLFVQLQQQLNRVASVLGHAQISIDGKIGNQTVSLANKVMDPSILEPSFLEKVFGPKTGCEIIASQVESLVPATRGFANKLQAAPVAEVRRKAPVMTKASMPPATSGSRWGLWLLGAAAVGGAYWYTTQRKGKKKRK